MTSPANDTFPIEGSCACKTIKYRMETRPLVVNCCHCTYCQRETGTAFALNAIIESNHITPLSSTPPEKIHTPSSSGKGQDIFRCPICHVAVWSHYAGAGPFLKCVRVGTLDRKLRPEAHIFTGTKVEWVDLRGEVERGVRVVEGYYEREGVWSDESLERWRVLQERVREWEKTGLIR